MLFNEAEICSETTEPESETEAIRIDVKSYQRKSKRTKSELTKDLPQKDIYYELPEEALHDEEGNQYEYVSTNLVRNEIMIIPKQILVINHYQKVYKADITIEGVPATKFLKAPVPKAVLPHSIANAATNYITYHTTYFNSLKAYIKSLRSINTISKVRYGMDIPERYQSDVWKEINKDEES